MTKFKDIRVHDFRRSCAFLLIYSSASITIVIKDFEHTKINKTLNNHSHMYKNRLNKIVNIIKLQNNR